MSGLTALMDTLLATRLAQRVDLVPLKSTAEIAGPGAVGDVEPVGNDLRLPSRAGLDARLGMGLAAIGPRGHAAARGTLGEAVHLSPAARAVSAMLDRQAGPTTSIVGAQPLLTLSEPSQAQPPLAPMLATALAQAVNGSGLFYESHLAQHAAGARTLAEMLREPQARLDAQATALPAEVAVPEAAAAPARQTHVDAAPQSSQRGPLAPATAAQPDGIGADGAVTQEAPSTAGAHAPGSTGAAAVHFPGVHPDAVALVRQQLELLAVPVFRWTGEAWAGVPMDWEVHEKHAEPDERQAQDAGEAAGRSWSSRLLLTLPMLREVEVCVSLTGGALRLHLAAREGSTRQLLDQAASALPARLDALGLKLTDLRIGAMAAAPAAGADSPDAGDAH